ncbi:unnamed protein product, partial [Rotaria magnacalcarata]
YETSSSSWSELTSRALLIENQFNEYIQTINQEITKAMQTGPFVFNYNVKTKY